MPRKILKSRKKSRVKKRSRKQRVRKSFSNKGKHNKHTRSSSMNFEELPQLGFKIRIERDIDLYRPCGNAGDIYDEKIRKILNDKIELEIKHKIDYEIKRRKFKELYDKMLLDKKIYDEILREKEKKERELERNKGWLF